MSHWMATKLGEGSCDVAIAKQTKARHNAHAPRIDDVNKVSSHSKLRLCTINGDPFSNTKKSGASL